MGCLSAATFVLAGFTAKHGQATVALFSPGHFFGMDRLAVDELHTMHLGLFAHFVAHAFWRILDADIWGVGAGLTNAVMHSVSFTHLKRRLSSWYKETSAKKGGLRVYEVPSSFDMGCIDPRDIRSLAAKAADTGTLLCFITAFLREHYIRMYKGAILVVVRGSSCRVFGPYPPGRRNYDCQ